MMRIPSPVLDQSTIYISRNEEAVDTITNEIPRGRKSMLRNSLTVYTIFLALLIQKSPFSFFYFPQTLLYFLHRVKSVNSRR